MLKIVNSAATAQRKVAPLPTPAQQQARQHTAICSTTWVQLSASDRQSWNNLGQTYSPPTVDGKPRPKTTSTGVAVYKALNTQRLQMGQSLLTSAPQMPEPVVPLGAFTLAAFHTGSQTGAFVFNLESGGYTGQIKVLASPGLSPGITKFRPSQMRQIAILSGLELGNTSLTASYAARFRAPAAGMQIALKLIPISASGFMGVYSFQYATVGVTNAASDSGLTLEKSE